MAATMGVLVKLSAFEKWVPARLYRGNTGIMVDWCYAGDRRFTEPYFQITIQDLMEHPFHALFRHQTPIEFLKQLQEAQPGLPPTGLIFHMSRCGSTLISQMLSVSPANIAICEADPLEMILRQSVGMPEIPAEQQEQWLRWMVSALGQRRIGCERHYFIKFDAFAAIRFDVILQAFPDVPWVFVYRDPIEVLASVVASPSSWAIPGAMNPGFLGLDFPSILAMPQDEYAARVLAAYCERALRHVASGGGRLLNFRELPGAVWTSLASHFRITFSPEEIAQMQARAGFDAKTGQKRFAGDSGQKRETAARLHELAAKWLDPLYARLEAARKTQDEIHSQK